MLAPLVALAALVPQLVAGQGSSSSDAAVASAAASVPSCALTCTLSIAGSSECGGISNITCLCTNQAFQASVFQCYVNTCASEAERNSAIAYGYQTCQTVGVTLDTTAIPSGITGLSTSSGGSTSAASDAGSTTSAPTSAAQTTTSQSSQATTSSAAQSSASPTGAASESLARGNMLVAAVGAVAGIAGFAAFFL